MSDKRADAQENVIDEVLAEALAAFGHLLTPGDRELASELLADMLATHPVTADLLDVIVAPEPLDHSDKVTKGEDATREDAADLDGAAVGGSGVNE